MDARLLVALRRFHNLTQNDVAKLLGVSRTMIAMIEIGDRQISRRLELRIINLFGEERVAHVRLTLQMFGGELDAND
jgi:transcriptional regulator with XRE-family HTH domain